MITKWEWIANIINIILTQVVIRPDKYFENTLNILQHLTRVEQAHLGNTVNKTLWNTNTAPAVVNAYYSRNKNQISQFIIWEEAMSVSFYLFFHDFAF